MQLNGNTTTMGWQGGQKKPVEGFEPKEPGAALEANGPTGTLGARKGKSRRPL